MPGFPLSQLLVGAGNARNAFVSGRRDAQAAAQDQQLKSALQAIQLKRQAQQDQLAQTLQAANVRNIDSQILNRRPPTPPRDPVADANAQWQFRTTHPMPTAPTDAKNPLIGSDAWKEAERFKASLRPPPQPPQASFTPTTVKDESGRDVVLPFNSRTGTVGEPIGGAKSSGGGVAGVGVRKAIAQNEKVLFTIDDALKELDAHPSATGLLRGLPLIGDRLDQRIDKEGVAARASIANVGSLQIHDRTGANMAIHEEPRLAPFVPNVGDTPDAIRTKLKKLRETIDVENRALQGQGMSAPTGGGRGGGPGTPSSAAPSAGGKPPLADRVQQLKASGLSKEAARAKLIQEGYNLTGTP